jgi:hypothetical protein
MRESMSNSMRRKCMYVQQDVIKVLQRRMQDAARGAY